MMQKCNALQYSIRVQRKNEFDRRRHLTALCVKPLSHPSAIDDLDQRRQGWALS